MNTNWINVNDKLPDILETVFISNGKGWTSVGCRTWCGDEWLWAETNGIFYEKDGKIVSECESDDDLDVKYWHPFPAPPKDEQPSANKPPIVSPDYEHDPERIKKFKELEKSFEPEITKRFYVHSEAGFNADPGIKSHWLLPRAKPLTDEEYNEMYGLPIRSAKKELSPITWTEYRRH